MIVELATTLMLPNRCLMLPIVARLSNEFLSRFSSLLTSFLRRGGFISSEAEQGKFACEVISAFDSNHHCPLTLYAHMRATYGLK